MSQVAIERWAKRWKLSPEEIHRLLDWLVEKIVVKGKERQKESGSGGTPSGADSVAGEIKALEEIIYLAQEQLRNVSQEERQLNISRERPMELARTRTEIGRLNREIGKYTEELQKLRGGKS
jgi:hypothetical protein